MLMRGKMTSIFGVGAMLCTAAQVVGIASGKAHSVGAQSAGAETCRQNIEAIFGRAPLGRSRVVVTFTGPQTSLMPLYETPYVHEFDVTLFPVERIKFVLTLQVRPTSADPARLSILASQLCALARQSGARFNGIMLYEGNDMTAAEMADPE